MDSHLQSNLLVVLGQRTIFENKRADAKTFVVAAKTDVYIPFRIRPPPETPAISNFCCRQEASSALAFVGLRNSEWMSPYPRKLSMIG
jgi:hypothetical protein